MIPKRVGVVGPTQHQIAGLSSGPGQVYRQAKSAFLMGHLTRLFCW
jgi:hypothetical protein